MLVRERLDRQVFHEALEDVWKVVRAANGYIDRQAPWALRRTDPARMAAVLRVLADVLRVIATVLQPFMPESMAQMLDQLGVPADARQLADLGTPWPDGLPCRRRRECSRAMWSRRVVRVPLPNPLPQGEGEFQKTFHPFHGS